MACRTGCPTQDHDSYAACLRGSGVRVAYCNSTNRQDYTRQKIWDRELASYRDAIRQGIEPDGTHRAAIDKAVRASDATGVAYRASGM
jgi:hypothetical protein